jgi:hypothetical protein
MLAGERATEPSNDAVGRAFDHDRRCIVVASHSLHVYDTTGLNQPLMGTVPGPQAVAILFKLIRSLADSDGIDFLVMVVKPEAIKERTVKNYELVVKCLCQKQVPVVIVITGLEHEATMDDWWTRNEGQFLSHRMTFEGHACISTTKGKETPSGYLLQSEYDQSKKTLERLISSRCRENKPWRRKADLWFQDADTSNSWKDNSFFDLFRIRTTPQTRMTEALQQHADLQKGDAKVIAQRIARCLTWAE